MAPGGPFRPSWPRGPEAGRGGEEGGAGLAREAFPPPQPPRTSKGEEGDKPEGRGRGTQISWLVHHLRPLPPTLGRAQVAPPKETSWFRSEDSGA